MSWPPLETLLPHGDGARCLDAIVEHVPGEHLLARLRVRPSLVLYDEARSGIPGWAGIELMAQAGGLYVGLGGYAAGERVPRAGYLVGVRRFRTKRETFGDGEELEVDAACVSAAPEGLGRFECRILTNGQTLASALLTLWAAPGGGQQG